MESKDIDRHLNELWKKVAGNDYVPDASPLPHDVRQSNMETMRFLRDNFSKAEGEWKSLLAGKDAQLRDLGAQLEETKAHLSEIKQHYQEAREKSLNEELSTALNLEESKKLLDAQKKNHAREIALLKELLERTKTEMISLQSRIDALRAERDEWHNKFTGLSVQTADLADAKAGLEAKLGDSKEAVEKTLSELLSERKNRRDDAAKMKDLEGQVKDLTGRLDAAKANWDAERTQWRELWDRERSVWETHRQEFAVWEERLRSEREAWTMKMREQESKGVENAAGLANVLKESSQWSEKVTQVLKLYALKGVELPSVFVSASPDQKFIGARKSVTRALALGLAGLMLLSVAGWQFYSYRAKAHYKLLSSVPLDLANPSGLAVTSEGLWVADWNKGLALKDIKDYSTLRVLPAPAGTPLRPGALTASDGGLWTLDMAQLRYARQNSKDGSLAEAVKTPGPAPQGAAWDGYSLWAFDASSGLLYKYGLDPASGAAATYTLDGVKTLACMQWFDGQLWVLDGKNVLRRYALEEKGFDLVSSQPFGKGRASSFWAGGGSLWTIEKAGELAGGYELKKYSLKLYK
ncbi:MAG TPA: hypothetical protein DEQ38_11080 [Elusimicrobia bacterium]|nr:MAG: hypothetical protein A2089_05810 [Elusimicrobia bacterium GWD2_63_28]OGR78929.1 MAG: hypothetical protein A2X38_03165 [Elusimicrobia bacterium GWC2_61_25]HCC48639.1 hypothetical protein [Elusimicrobiota bacterium]